MSLSTIISVVLMIIPCFITLKYLEEKIGAIKGAAIYITFLFGFLGAVNIAIYYETKTVRENAIHAQLSGVPITENPYKNSVHSALWYEAYLNIEDSK